MNPVNTDRLTIVPLTLALLELCVKGRWFMENALNLEQTVTSQKQPPYIEKALLDMISNVKLHPQDWFWYTNWEIVLKEENRIIGGFAFCGPCKNGEVEIAYVIQEAYRGRMFATEAIKALIDFAFSFDKVEAVIAVSEKNNPASIKLLEGLGFICSSEDNEGNLIFKRNKKI